jgi:hypothetical protein
MNSANVSKTESKNSTVERVAESVQGNHGTEPNPNDRHRI